MRRGPSAVNALLAVYKPAGMTSHDVVSRVRRALGERRVGHAGTLDPAATGVLVVGVGQATKLLGLLTLDRKGYRATFQLGAETTTDDAEGEVTRTADVDAALLGSGAASRAVASLTGEHDQVPPAYSAVSVDGRRAYDRARAGEDVELAARRVTVHAARLEAGLADERRWVVDLDVSKGTYVRSIARDLGRELGCLAHVCALERTFAGPVGLRDCVCLDELAQRGADLVRERCLDPAAVLGLARRELSLDEVADVSCGRRIAPATVTDALGARHPRPGERVSLVFAGALAGIWRREGAHLVCETNFPQAVEGVWEAPDLASVRPESPLPRAAAVRLLREASPAGARAARQLPRRSFDLADGVARVDVTFGLAVPEDALGPGRASSGLGLVFAVGAFDGMHLGHRALFARARAEADARGCRFAAVTFSPDPALVLGPRDQAPDLLFFGEHPDALLDFGADALVVVRFTPALARLSFKAFVEDVLMRLADVRALVVGADFNFGAGGAGTVGALAELGGRDGFDVVGVELSRAGGEAITSTSIRSLVREGRVEEAAALLGRAYHTFGEVEHGRGEGTGLGFPTANVRAAAERCLPAEGVYAGWVCVEEPAGPGADGAGARLRAWPAAINVGKPRTFSPGEEGQAFLEATLLGFEGDLYGRTVQVVFARWLRGPQRFSSADELKRVVLDNVGWVRRALGEGPLDLGRLA